MKPWERRAAAYRLEQMRAHQLREKPPVPERRERKPRTPRIIGRRPIVWHRDLFSGDHFIYGPPMIWWIDNERARLYAKALGL